jgi:hypothetical protein
MAGGNVMTTIPISLIAGAICRPTPARRGVAGFGVVEDASVPSRPMAASGGVSLVSLDSMLALQEVDPAPERDRRARRHGEALLDALAQLQRALLRGEADPAVLQRLADLAGRTHPAASAGLRAAVAAIQLRAAVELARHDNNASAGAG